MCSRGASSDSLDRELYLVTTERTLVYEDLRAKDLFEGASVTLEEGDRVGLLGINGSGKSTLLRVIAGLEAADSGVIDRRKGARVLYLSQSPRSTQRERTGRSPRGSRGADETKARHAAVTEAIDAGDRGAAGSPSRLCSQSASKGSAGGRGTTSSIEILHKLGVGTPSGPWAR